MSRVAAFLSLLALLAMQEMPDPETLLSQQGQRISKRRSLSYVWQYTAEQKGYKDGKGGTKLTQETTVYFAAPGKLRVERKLDNLVDHIVVSNGEFVWIYRPRVKQYMKRRAVLGPEAASVGVSWGSSSREKATLRESAVRVDGKERPCWVLEETYTGIKPGTRETAEGIATHCLDKELGINLESSVLIKLRGNVPFDRMEDKGRARNLRIDQPLADTLFTFNPPKDSKEVPLIFNLDLPWGNLTGSVAPQFRFRDVNGAVHDESSWRGKTVLLVFVRASCLPCREAMIRVEDTYLTRRDEGLVAMAIFVEDDAAVVEGALSDLRVSYPVAIASRSALPAVLELRAYPTYILIDPAGRIAAHSVGVSETTPSR